MPKTNPPATNETKAWSSPSTPDDAGGAKSRMYTGTLKSNKYKRQMVRRELELPPAALAMRTKTMTLTKKNIAERTDEEVNSSTVPGESRSEVRKKSRAARRQQVVFVGGEENVSDETVEQRQQTKAPSVGQRKQQQQQQQQQQAGEDDIITSQLSDLLRGSGTDADSSDDYDQPISGEFIRAYESGIRCVLSPVSAEAFNNSTAAELLQDSSQSSSSPPPPSPLPSSSSSSSDTSTTAIEVSPSNIINRILRNTFQVPRAQHEKILAETVRRLQQQQNDPAYEDLILRRTMADSRTTISDFEDSNKYKLWKRGETALVDGLVSTVKNSKFVCEVTVSITALKIDATRALKVTKGAAVADLFAKIACLPQYNSSGQPIPMDEIIASNKESNLNALKRISVAHNTPFFRAGSPSPSSPLATFNNSPTNTSSRNHASGVGVGGTYRGEISVQTEPMKFTTSNNGDNNILWTTFASDKTPPLVFQSGPLYSPSEQITISVNKPQTGLLSAALKEAPLTIAECKLSLQDIIDHVGTGSNASGANASMILSLWGVNQTIDMMVELHEPHDHTPTGSQQKGAINAFRNRFSVLIDHRKKSSSNATPNSLAAMMAMMNGAPDDEKIIGNATIRITVSFFKRLAVNDDPSRDSAVISLPWISSRAELISTYRCMVERFVQSSNSRLLPPKLLQRQQQQIAKQKQQQKNYLLTVLPGLLLEEEIILNDYATRFGVSDTLQQLIKLKCFLLGGHFDSWSSADANNASGVSTSNIDRFVLHIEFVSDMLRAIQGSSSSSTSSAPAVVLSKSELALLKEVKAITKTYSERVLSEFKTHFSSTNENDLANLETLVQLYRSLAEEDAAQEEQGREKSGRRGGGASASSGGASAASTLVVLLVKRAIAADYTAVLTEEIIYGNEDGDGAVDSATARQGLHQTNANMARLVEIIQKKVQEDDECYSYSFDSEITRDLYLKTVLETYYGFLSNDIDLMEGASSAQESTKSVLDFYMALKRLNDTIEDIIAGFATDVKCNINYVKASMLAAPHFEKWLNDTKQHLFKWCMNAVAIEKWQPISPPKVLHSASVVDIFSIFYQSIDFLKLAEDTIMADNKSSKDDAVAASSNNKRQYVPQLVEVLAAVISEFGKRINEQCIEEIMNGGTSTDASNNSNSSNNKSSAAAPKLFSSGADFGALGNDGKLFASGADFGFGRDGKLFGHRRMASIKARFGDHNGSADPSEIKQVVLPEAFFVRLNCIDAARQYLNKLVEKQEKAAQKKAKTSGSSGADGDEKEEQQEDIEDVDVDVDESDCDNNDDDAEDALAASAPVDERLYTETFRKLRLLSDELLTVVANQIRNACYTALTWIIDIDMGGNNNNNSTTGGGRRQKKKGEAPAPQLTRQQVMEQFGDEISNRMEKIFDYINEQLNVFHELLYEDLFLKLLTRIYSLLVQIMEDLLLNGSSNTGGTTSTSSNNNTKPLSFSQSYILELMLDNMDEFFLQNGDGLPINRIRTESKLVRQLMALYDNQTEVLIYLYEVLAHDAQLHNRAATNNNEIIVRDYHVAQILFMRRNDPVAEQFVKNNHAAVQNRMVKEYFGLIKESNDDGNDNGDDEEVLIDSFHCTNSKMIHGRLYVTNRHLCFDTNLRMRLSSSVSSKNNNNNSSSSSSKRSDSKFKIVIPLNKVAHLKKTPKTLDLFIGRGINITMDDNETTHTFCRMPKRDDCFSVISEAATKLGLDLGVAEAKSSSRGAAGARWHPFGLFRHNTPASSPANDANAEISFLCSCTIESATTTATQSTPPVLGMLSITSSAVVFAADRAAVNFSIPLQNIVKLQREQSGFGGSSGGMGVGGLLLFNNAQQQSNLGLGIRDTQGTYYRFSSFEGWCRNQAFSRIVTQADQLGLEWVGNGDTRMRVSAPAASTTNSSSNSNKNNNSKSAAAAADDADEVMMTNATPFDKELQDKFSLPPNQYFVQRFDCRRGRSGYLYVFRSYLCFEVVDLDAMSTSSTSTSTTAANRENVVISMDDIDAVKKVMSDNDDEEQANIKIKYKNGSTVLFKAFSAADQAYSTIREQLAVFQHESKSGSSNTTTTTNNSKRQRSANKASGTSSSSSSTSATTNNTTNDPSAAKPLMQLSRDDIARYKSAVSKNTTTTTTDSGNNTDSLKAVYLAFNHMCAGKFYIGTRHVLFEAFIKVPGKRTNFILLPIRDIASMEELKPRRNLILGAPPINVFKITMKPKSSSGQPAAEWEFTCMKEQSEALALIQQHGQKYLGVRIKVTYYLPRE